MAITAVASDGNNVPVYDLPQVLGYSGSDLTTITVQYERPTTPQLEGGLINYIQTLTYTGSNVTAISNWVAQS